MSRGLVWAGGTEAAVRDVPALEPRDGWVRVDVAVAGLCGSDLHVLAGEHVRARPGIVLGHEFAGRLAEATTDLPAGTPVFVDPQVRCGRCDACRRGLRTVCAALTAVGIDYPGAASPQTLVPVENVYALPPSLELTRAGLVEPVAVAVRAVRRSGLGPGDRVHVVGAGPIGCLVGLVAQRAGADVTVAEPAPARADAAAALGLRTVDPADRRPEHDVVLDATGTPRVSASVCDWVRPGGTLVVVGAYPPQPPPFDLLRVMFAELTVLGTRIYDHEDIHAAIELLDRDPGRVPDVVTRTVPLADAVAAVADLRAGRAMKILLDPKE
ncbi:2-desacetyl-2-hydroxyethyl bacteriochlorophyllide A dehydrogenase [Jatrophihabitans endophyticus]|uniref:2-desacetyl-2-hydroxyethyl bacteriochlorophyllide A dehydrogenase n=1 Tax=Jatrophihabitans endophyticus TaxID=1206085 RepID=A0A1M5S653_9ACTN|nr:alcohol dehydrogenase catalytic domain-containing protein [Jatrophihabitans endophyticus]SHH34087.1 2-desacetyl-2-hydroxyethyl bacteriochlorophyllide A dehydrogenase [Jatrophihabitans endophyticus]